MHDEGELDMRGTYCAVASASLLGKNIFEFRKITK